MGGLLERFFPRQADNNYTGYRIAAWTFLLIAVTGFIRSCIHLLAPDGGAGSIAGMDLTVGGAGGIVFAFALWGSAQLLYAVIQLVVFCRYRTLIPFMYLLILAEALLRMLVGQMRPVQFAHTPPGAIGNYVILPVVVVMLLLSLKRTNAHR